MKLYTESTSGRRNRAPGKRRCDHCQRWHKPLSASVRYCGSCSAKLLTRVTWRGLWR